MSSGKVLVVDDDADCVAFVAAVLEEDGLSVISANDGDPGLRSAEAEKPDLIILDLQMPGKDGFATFRELKQNEATRDIPVIMLTGLGDSTGVRLSQTDVEAFVGFQPDGYVEKPVDPALLLTLVKRVLGQ